MCVACLTKRPQTAYEHARWLRDGYQYHEYSDMVFGLF
jgi:hypothetical protein